MTTEEKLDRLTETLGTFMSGVDGSFKRVGNFMSGVDETFKRINNILEPLASTVAAHDNQIEVLMALAERNFHAIAALQEATANLERQWQAYVNRLPRQ